MSITLGSLSIVGKITECAPLVPSGCETVVYQRVGPGFGNISNGGRFDRQRRAWVKPFDPQTPAQLAVRARFASGVAAWRALTEEQRAAWSWLADYRRISTFNAFMSNHLRT